MVIPPRGEANVHISHRDELVTLDKVLYTGDLPRVDYGVSFDIISSLPDIPAPRENTYVLNLRQMTVHQGEVYIETNYTSMRSQFSLRRWLPLLEGEYQQKIMDTLLPLAGTMMVETSDQQLVMEERGAVEIPGKYHPAPAGGYETRDWNVRPELFRSIKGEAWEEIGLLPGSDYNSEISLIGIARDQMEAYNPTLIYCAQTHLSFDSVKKYAENMAPEAKEHQRLFAIPTASLELLAFMNDEERIIGNGLGCLLVFGYYKHGEDWFREAQEKLRRKDWEIVVHTSSFM